MKNVIAKVGTGLGTVVAAGSLALVGSAVLATECSAATLPAPAPHAFNQNMNAADGIQALESDGYNVEINWGGGRTDQSLSLCRMGAVDGLRGSGAKTAGTSVYVTVIC